MEDKQEETSQVETANLLKPIGMRVIGEVDPRLLTEEQFRKSSDLLFHGAKADFRFSREFDYRSPDYCEKSDGSQTLGEGFYTTAEGESAKNYSVVRQFERETKSVVVEVLPYQAKVLDLRAQTDPAKNAPVPEELFDKWYEKFKAYYYNNADLRENLPWYVREEEYEYRSYLAKLKESRPTPDLRVMLGTASTGTLEIPTLNYPSPPWMKLFSNFMVEEGYDGIA